jgi:hypothetical protein
MELLPQLTSFFESFTGVWHSPCFHAVRRISRVRGTNSKIRLIFSEIPFDVEQGVAVHTHRSAGGNDDE